MTALSLWLKWSLRDLRQRWLQVIAIAMVIALGTGVYCGLGGNKPWRLKSLDESYAMLNIYDLKMELMPGSTLDADELAQVVDAVEGVQDSEMRLVLPTFVDASTPDRTIVVSGRIVGVDVSSGGPAINGIHVTAGRALRAEDSGEPVCIVEHHFANYYDLQPGDREIGVRGGLSLDPVGIGMSPEYFMVMTEEGGMMAEASFAALFLPLKSVQEMASLPGMANDVLITVAAGVDVEAVKQALREAMAEAFPEVGVTFEEKSENDVYSLMYEDVPGDQAMYDILAFLVLAGAALGAFTLVSRMVESQRREIGISMALGVEPSIIARRYLFAGAQIALLGVLLGLVAGAVLSQAYGNLLRDVLPMPYFETPFQVPIFLRGALLGIAIPLLAAVYPIWRAVRVTPVEAIQSGHLVATGGGLAPTLARFHLPGSSFTRFPFRNLSRNPRRALFTILGIAIAVIVLVATIGMLDSMTATLDAGREEHLKGALDRMLVTLDSFCPVALLPITGHALDPRISKAEPIITLPCRVSSRDGEAFDVIVQLMDLGNDLWTPTLLRGDKHGEGPGVIISEKAARDLGVDVGDTVTLEHPYRGSLFAYRMQESEVQVGGIHADVLRLYLYMDIEDAAMMNLRGWMNSLQISPAAGVKEEEVRKELSQMQGVASVISVSALVDTYAELIEMFVGMFKISQCVAILLAFLIAFNTTSINVEERRRELATMFAFGTRLRTAIRMAVMENLVTGILSTLIGLGLGWVVLNQLLGWQMEKTVPEIGLLIQVAPSTLALVAFFGVLVVALTPVFTIRKLAQMDIPSTLRVVE
jgi:putative ABC transport system permease protein